MDRANKKLKIGVNVQINKQFHFQYLLLYSKWKDCPRSVQKKNNREKHVPFTNIMSPSISTRKHTLKPCNDNKPNLHISWNKRPEVSRN